MNTWYMDRLPRLFLEKALERVPKLENPQRWTLRRLLEEEWYPAWCEVRNQQQALHPGTFNLSRLDTSPFWSPRWDTLRAWGLGAEWVRHAIDAGLARGLPFEVVTPPHAELAFNGAYKELLPDDLDPRDAKQAVSQARIATGQDPPPVHRPHGRHVDPETFDPDELRAERLEDLARHLVERTSLLTIARHRGVDKTRVSHRLTELREILSLPPRPFA